MWSADTTIGRARARARVDGRPVDDLKFAKAAMLLTVDDDVDLAMRHGVAAPRGLLLDHGFVAQVLAPANLKAQRANQDAIAEQLAVVERRTEDVGSLRSHRHAAAYEGADQDLERRIKKAEEAARETLQAAPDEDLVRHWTRLGGAVPATLQAGLAQDLVGAPSISTMQQPHCSSPQPNRAPTRPSSLRSTASSEVSSLATVTLTARPLTLRSIFAIARPWCQASVKASW